MDHDEFVDELQRNIPQEWEASEGSAESIVLDYVHALEKAVDLLGGHRGAYDGGQTVALGEFYARARACASAKDSEASGLVPMLESWDTYVQVKAEAE